MEAGAGGEQQVAIEWKPQAELSRLQHACRERTGLMQTQSWNWWAAMGVGPARTTAWGRGYRASALSCCQHSCGFSTACCSRGWELCRMGLVQRICSLTRSAGVFKE